MKLTGEREIEKIEDVTEQRNIAVSTALLAGLKLDKEVVERIMRSDIMRESVIYQDIIQQGSKQEATAFALRLLKQRLGKVNTELETQVRALSVEQLEACGRFRYTASTASAAMPEVISLGLLLLSERLRR